MNRDREQMWQAYVDGELSACEAAQFEASLSESERTQLASEMRFARALSERMREDVTCPVAAWDRARALVNASGGGRPRVAMRWVMTGATLAAAAALAFVISDVAGLFDTPEQSNIIHAAASVTELKSESEIPPGWDSAQTFLREHGIQLSLEDQEHILSLMRPHSPIDIVGARQDELGGSVVTELLVACCDKPVRVLLAPKHSGAARAIGKAAADDTGDIQATRKVNGYVAAVVAKHPSHGLVNIVDADVH